MTKLVKDCPDNESPFPSSRRHRCPHTPPPAVIPLGSDSGPACLLSEYGEKFVSHGNTAVRISKHVPEELQPPEGPISNTTTFRSDYVPHRLTPRAPKPVQVCSPPAVEMALQTTYMQDFTQHPTQRNIVSKTEQHWSPPAKMDTRSVYNEEYRPWSLLKQKPFKTKDNLTISTEKFSALSTAQDDYCPKPGAVARHSFKPVPVLKESPPFEGDTTHRLSYVSHPPQRRAPRQKIVYEPNSVPLEAVSTHRHDYRGLRGERPRSCKARITWDGHRMPFEEVSEFQDKYREWKQPPCVRQRCTASYSPPEGEMELVSTAHGDFKGTRASPARSARPPIKAWSKGAPFEARSAMKEDYRAWESAERSCSAKPPHVRQSPDRFSATTTFRAHYTPKTASRAASFKPEAARLTPRHMETDTVYRCTYSEHKIQPCPASHAQPPGFHYTGKGRGGHLLYRPTAAPEKGVARPATAGSAKPKVSAATRPVKSAIFSPCKS
ncbi:stabilizer of axonemal microtubules 2-like [Chanos chanos]|uniref:Stabilizer of axonemal microtubules 2-like n=1 Tax=Chanos chanos TaxID=29144 RepID=A0A6J2WKC3_CHACN|nr:stabilizer of axonemal microtubules 2-like [Chanos chanos]